MPGQPHPTWAAQLEVL